MGPALHPVVEEQSLGPSQGTGTCVSLPRGHLVAKQELESLEGLHPEAASLTPCLTLLQIGAVFQCMASHLIK